MISEYPLELFENICASTELRFPEGALDPDCVDLCKSFLRKNPVERITFTEFFDHKFLREPGLEVNTKQSSLPPRVKSVVDHFDSYAVYKSSHLHSGNPRNSFAYFHEKASESSNGCKSNGCDKIKTSSGIADSMEFIEKEYVVNANFASVDYFSFYHDTSLHDVSGPTNSICPPTNDAPDIGIDKQAKELGQLQIHDTDSLYISRSSSMLREGPILHATKLQFFFCLFGGSH